MKYWMIGTLCQVWSYLALVLMFMGILERDGSMFICGVLNQILAQGFRHYYWAKDSSLRIYNQ